MLGKLYSNVLLVTLNARGSRGTPHPSASLSGNIHGNIHNIHTGTELQWRRNTNTADDDDEEAETPRTVQKVHISTTTRVTRDGDVSIVPFLPQFWFSLTGTANSFIISRTPTAIANHTPARPYRRASHSPLASLSIHRHPRRPFLHLFNPLGSGKNPRSTRDNEPAAVARPRSPLYFASAEVHVLS